MSSVTVLQASSFASLFPLCACMFSYPKNFLWLGKISDGAVSHGLFIAFMWTVVFVPGAAAREIEPSWAPWIAGPQLFLSFIVFPYLSFGVPQGDNLRPFFVRWLKGEEQEKKTPAEMDDDLLLRFVNRDLVRWIDQAGKDEIWAEIEKRGLQDKVHKRFRRT